MKTTYKGYLNFLLTVLLSTTFTSSFAFAQTENPKLAANFSFTELLKDAVKLLSPSEEKATTTDIKSDAEATTTSLTACEYFDQTTVNVLDLQAASSDTKQRIANVEQTIADEENLRDSLLNSTTTKTLTNLQKKDKAVFKEMKKQIEITKKYYSGLDAKLVTTQEYLDLNSCDETEVDEAKNMADNVSALVSEEIVYRKQFISTLKDKMKSLQNNVKEAKNS